jgi:hypothetical protein
MQQAATCTCFRFGALLLHFLFDFGLWSVLEGMAAAYRHSGCVHAPGKDIETRQVARARELFDSLAWRLYIFI